MKKSTTKATIVKAKISETKHRTKEKIMIVMNWTITTKRRIENARKESPTNLNGNQMMRSLSTVSTIAQTWARIQVSKMMVSTSMAKETSTLMVIWKRRLTDEYLDDDNKDGIHMICTMMMCHRMGSKRMMGLKTRTGTRTLRMMSGLTEKIKTRKTALTKSKKT